MPLAVIAGSFFVPTLKTCSTMQSPLEVAADGLVWVVPWYLAALVLAVATTVAMFRRRVPSRADWVFGVVSVAVCGLVALVGFLGAAYELPSSPDDVGLWFAVSVTLVPLAVGTRSLIRARAHHGWSAWTRLLLGYTSFVLPLSGLFVLHVYEDGHAGDLGPGAYAVVIGTLVLGAILLLGREASERSASSPAASND